jgi:SAM-dependent methyltransferase
LAITPETLRRRGRELRSRYTAADVGVLSQDEMRRFVGGGAGDPRTDVTLAWELLYRLEPGLYDRLACAERLHPAVLRWLPDNVERIIEVAAGTGRLTLDLLHRARELVAVEPAGPLREILGQKLARADRGHRARVTHGFFDDLPMPDACAELVVSCSALTPDPGHGSEAGLAEMERVCRPGGCVVLVWPNDVAWLTGHGYQYVSFGGEMCLEFATAEEAVDLVGIFYPDAVGEVRHRGCRRVPHEVLGINPPRDLAFKIIPR